MKIVVSQDRCSGHGRCAAVAPEVYELDVDGYCAISELEVAPASEAGARGGADACPESAIAIV